MRQHRRFKARTLNKLSALLQRLEVNNAELLKVNEEIENCLPEDTFKEEYEEALQYDDRANQAIGHLKAKIAAVQASAITTSSALADNRLSDVLEFLLVETESREKSAGGDHAAKERRVQHQGGRSKQTHAPSAAVLHTQPEEVRRYFFCDSVTHHTQ
ncbi:hypothetical protein HPB50_012703 [Hyalomma asiaticum]|uniref:Uncharacterized protein n=1 Tax=Hyalomma asiaticum TaxID=266040 RepID=A0ACB7RWW5_HYAAI|nr:hypothetical protein HPB50_012703 [Hyalomma asiaticum]